MIRFIRWYENPIAWLRAFARDVAYFYHLAPRRREFAERMREHSSYDVVHEPDAEELKSYFPWWARLLGWHRR